MAERFIAHHVEVIASDECGERKDSTAEPFADHEHVRNNAVMFAGENFPRPTKADRHFIEYQERAMLVACGPDFLPIILRRNKRSAANGFGDDGGNVPLFLEHVLDVICALQITGFAAFEWAMAIIRRRHVLAAGEQRSDPGAEDCFAAN